MTDRSPRDSLTSWRAWLGLAPGPASPPAADPAPVEPPEPVFDPEAAIAALSQQFNAQIAALNARIHGLEAAVSGLSAVRVPHADLWREPPPLLAGATPSSGMVLTSELCRQDSFAQPWFSYWTGELDEVLRYHRKLWEFVFICQALHERGLLTEGSRGLGFGVGGEPLGACFAARGCVIVGSDQAADAALDAGWAATGQLAVGLESLRRPRICPDETFDVRVSFRHVDMNAVPEDLTGFDFCWSACALEHLGSIEHGLAFIARSLDTLRPGGVAVHTTEFNLSSNHETVDHLSTVLFRKRDLEVLASRLTAAGHVVAPLNLDPGAGAVDAYVDVAPYRAEPHLKLALEGFAATSVGLIIQKASA